MIVLTHEPPPGPTLPDVTFLDDFTEAVAAAKDAAGGRYVNVLGADVAAQCLRAGMLDEILVFIAPVLLGDGTPLFQQAGGTEIGLEPIHPERTGPTGSWFRVSR